MHAKVESRRECLIIGHFLPSRRSLTEWIAFGDLQDAAILLPPPHSSCSELRSRFISRHTEHSTRALGIQTQPRMLEQRQVAVTGLSQPIVYIFPFEERNESIPLVGPFNELINDLMNEFNFFMWALICKDPKGPHAHSLLIFKSIFSGTAIWH